MSIVAERYEFVIGVDTHAATHTYALIGCPAGQLLDQRTFATTAAGLGRAEAWIGRRSAGEASAVLIVIEGTCSYGAVLTERLASSGYRVVEAPSPSHADTRGTGKTDALDAARMATAVLGIDSDRLRDPRAGQVQSALRVLTVARQHMNGDRTHTVNALTALIRANDLGLDARKALTGTQIKTVATWRTRHEPLGTATARTEALRLAKDIVRLEAELKQNRTQLDHLIARHAPVLLEQHGIGAISAALILTAWSHPGRIRSEAALAKIAGTCPIPASSGNTIRHRLNRGGDRTLNKAIHTIALTRMRNDPATRAYVTRRTAEGRTKREIIRSLKRYITRQIHRTLAANPPNMAT